MFTRFLFAPAALILAGSFAQAQPVDPDKGAALFEALGLPQMMQIMREEGLDYGTEIGEDLFDGRATDEWSAMVSKIYDVDRMRAEVANELNAALEGDDIDAMLAFFTTQPGQSIIELELSARRALLDEEIEDASKEIAAQAMTDETPRYLQVKRFVVANDLVETNVVGAMNANVAFYKGLADGGAFQDALSEEQILADVWGQEPEIRVNTTEWVYSFLLLAYQPLKEGELDAYIAFSQTQAGKDLNEAMFAAFDDMFEGISRALGLGSAQFMSGQDI